jgi:tight adherence protein C
VSVGIVVGAMLVLIGATTVYAGLRLARLSSGPVAHLQQLETASQPDLFEERLRQPFLKRLVRPLGQRLIKRIASMAPSDYLNRVHRSLLHAGLYTSITAEEFAAAQVVSIALALLGALLCIAALHPPSRLGPLLLLLGAIAGGFLPSAWLRRAASHRSEAIFNELPDVLDLLAISVEAGTALEQAMAIAGSHFTSPLADELVLTLREMELGLPRRQALQNLKRRAGVPELANLVAVLIQSEALGMPIGRVLHVQAREMRERRRQRAREKAAKLPVKILFPMIVFIFPAIFVVVLGPAMISILRVLK